MDSYRIKNLTFTYPTRTAPALNDISLDVARGEFLTFCGPSGCGKTTLLRQLKPILSPHGARGGEVYFEGRLLSQLTQREQSEHIGFVSQSPENQVVTDKVWHELAFGLESLGLPSQAIRLRVSEMASFFGIQNWFYRNVSDLSGGQKQLLNLASIMVMQPSVLILDEPTGQLDPIAAADFLATVGKINRELGVTVLMTEHRLEEVFPLSDRVACMDAGRIICTGTPSDVGMELRNSGHGMFLAMPTPMRVFAAAPETGELGCPVTIRDGRVWLAHVVAQMAAQAEPAAAAQAEPAAAAQAEPAGAAQTATQAEPAGAAQVTAPDAAAAEGEQAAASASPPLLNGGGDSNLAPLAKEGMAPAGLEAPGGIHSRQPGGDCYATASKAGQPLSASNSKNIEKNITPVLELDEVWFRYEKGMPDVLKGLTLKVMPGDFLCILGGNGAGKTTSMSLFCGAVKPYRGKVKLFGKELKDYPDGELFNGVLGALPQNPQALFIKKTVYEDLLEVLSGRGLSKDEQSQRAMDAARLCHIQDLLGSHPYDLSGGEQQRAALAKVLLLQPRVLLLDEPTKGLDAEFKQVFAGILNNLIRHGVSVVMASHDIEFCAEFAKTCVFIFDGNVVSAGAPREFFGGNSFYTTASSRMSRGLISGAVTPRDIIEAIGGTGATAPDYSEETAAAAPAASGGITGTAPAASDGATCAMPTTSVEAAAAAPAASDDAARAVPTASVEAAAAAAATAAAPAAFINAGARFSATSAKSVAWFSSLPIWRKAAAGAVALMFALTAAYILADPTQFLALTSAGDTVTVVFGHELWTYIAVILALCTEAIGFSMLLFHGRSPKSAYVRQQTHIEKHKLPMRTVVASLIILIAIPLTIFVGMHYLNERKYYFISIIVILETLLPFVLVFEGRKPQARELVIIAVLCAIGASGRTAFFMLPQFKPVTAMVILAGVAFGGEAGFLVGAVTAFASNMFFGQGPWTAWQMFAFGLIGFLAGALFHKGLLRRSRIQLCIFGGLSAIVIYGGIMNTAMLLMTQGMPAWPMFILSVLRGIPFDMVHAAATVTFLWLVARPMLEKLDRIKIKYGLIQ